MNTVIGKWLRSLVEILRQDGFDLIRVSVRRTVFSFFGEKGGGDLDEPTAFVSAKQGTTVGILESSGRFPLME
ncbi:hypothetical protein X798_03270 [Onchocerca flexuosa]|uniref:HORMA domain-containing protein n=2 Tax=Onchocerca flexuosa TaxID=387005 RepID=A0A183HZU2_9BILA|nr:hypothetical protein X798_03270 [Onchocerca flexuosa]VDP12692.1 unnamed protein product [Onchocerca flexuosa]